MNEIHSCLVFVRFKGDEEMRYNSVIVEFLVLVCYILASLIY